MTGAADPETELWRRVDRVFREALAIPSDRRREFVVTRCDGDEVVGQRVLQLLRDSEAGPELTGPGEALVRAAWADLLERERPS